MVIIESKKFNFLFGEIDMSTFSFTEIGGFNSMYSPDLSFGNRNIIGESNQVHNIRKQYFGKVPLRYF
jgi:hypothetical protein